MAGSVALYLRLSSADEFVDEVEGRESNSIVNQRMLLHGKIANYGFDETEVTEYVDDGYSGKNFNRPAITKLLEDVRDEKVRTIFVKDFSRFGRDHITNGDYIEKIFPFLNVRFIAVEDHFDSNEWIGSTPEMDVAFRNILNDYFSEENSVKIKHSLNALRRNGNYLASMSLYGYLKSEEDNHKLVIDKPAAKIVQRIFQYRLDGLNGGEIARKLNNDGVPTPTEYFHSIGRDQNHRSVKKAGKALWQAASINSMIHNREYTGCLVAGKYKTVETGSNKVVTTDKEKWIVVEDTHEAIIDPETFEKAQHVFCPRKRPVGKIKPKEYYESPLKGIVRCGGCGHKLTRKAQKNPSYFCKYFYFDYNDNCVETTFPEADLMKIVVQAVKNQLLFVSEMEHLCQTQKKKVIAERKELEKEIGKHQKNINRLKKENFELYEQYREETISVEKYRARKQKNQQRIEIEEMQVAKLTTKHDVMKNFEKFEDIVLTYREAANGLEEEQVSVELVQELIEGVYLHSKKRLEIRFRFADQMEEIIRTMTT